jgi:hypothetical protein
LCQNFIQEKSRAGHIFKHESTVDKFKSKVSGAEEFNCGDYRKLLEGEFVLSKWEVNLNPYEDFLYSNPMHYAPDEISGYLIAPFKEWAAGSRPLWWEAFTGLKHDRMKNFREAKLKNAIYSLAAVFIILTLRHETEFKLGAVSPELYDLFFPKYWTSRSRVALMNFVWMT